MVEHARDTCACAFEHLLSFGVHMLSAVERARAHVLQMASAERGVQVRRPEPEGERLLFRGARRAREPRREADERKHVRCRPVARRAQGRRAGERRIDVIT